MKPERNKPMTDDEIDTANEPPNAHRMLMAVLNAYILLHQALPACMPYVPRDAMNWWLSRQEPETKRERPRQVPVAGRERMRWEAPYVLRITQNLRKFLSMPAAQQRVIIAAIEDGIPWRGDDYERFLEIMNQHEIMREIDVEEYRRQCLKQFKLALERVA